LVTTNDPKNLKVKLFIEGRVEKFANITPRIAAMFGKTGERIVKTLKIIPEPKYPFKITGGHSEKMGNIRFAIDELPTPDQTGYILTVENVKNNPGRYYDSIILKTDSHIVPEITVVVRGSIQE